MSKEYKITRVSTQEPREWKGPKGTTYYINVMLEGHPKAVSIGKKRPDALKVGDTVYGEITETQYDTDKFTASQNPSGGGYSKKPQDNTTMYVSYAKDILVAMLTSGKDLKDFDAYITKIAESGKKLKELVESEPKKDWVKPEIRQKLEDRIPHDEVPPEAYDNITEETEVNYDDIPF